MLKCGGGGDFKASVPHISVLAAKAGENVQLDSSEEKTGRCKGQVPPEIKSERRRGRRELQPWPHVCGYLHCQPNQAKQTLGLGEWGGVGSSSLCPALRISPNGHLLKLPLSSQQSHSHLGALVGDSRNVDSPCSLLVPGLNGRPHVSCFLITWK